MRLRHWLKDVVRMLELMACVCLFTFTAVAHQKPGTLIGHVIGLSGEEVSNAPLEAKSLESGQILKTSSSANGRYSFTDLAIGKYEVSSPVAGFERKEIEVHAEETVRMDIRFIEIGTTLGTIGDGDLGTRLTLYNRPLPPAGNYRCLTSPASLRRGRPLLVSRGISSITAVGIPLGKPSSPGPCTT